MQTKDLRNTLEPIYNLIEWSELATLEPINADWGWFESRLGLLGHPMQGFTPEDATQLAGALRLLSARINSVADAIAGE